MSLRACLIECRYIVVCTDPDLLSSTPHHCTSHSACSFVSNTFYFVFGFPQEAPVTLRKVLPVTAEEANMLVSDSYRRGGCDFLVHFLLRSMKCASMSMPLHCWC